MRARSDRVALIAKRQHGRVTRGQLPLAGVDRNRIARWLADGRLRRLHSGVYAVGHEAPSLHGDYIAAVLAAGRGAVLSHAAAARLMGLVAGATPPPEVTIPGTAGRRRPGVRIHRSSLHPLDTSVFERIPVTIVPRVLLDLAPRSAPALLARACHEAWIRHGTTPAQAEACIARNAHKPGAARLRRALGADVTLSALEDAFLELLEAHRLPRPRTNVDHRGDRVDCHWPRFGLTVELLSYRFRASRRAFEADVARRRRSNHVAYTYGEVFDLGDRTAAEIAALIAGLERRPLTRSPSGADGSA
jgi:hypothetical protein